MMKLKLQSPIAQWSVLIILVIIWGSSFILMKKALLVFSASEVGAMRIAISFIVLLPLAVKRLRRIPVKDWILFLIVGFIGNTIPAFLFAWAQTGIDSSLAGILNSLTPLFTMILGILFFSFKVKWFNVLGVFLALIGAIGLIRVSGSGDFDFNLSYSLLVLLATICYAININVVKKFLPHRDPVTITVFAFLTMGIPVLLYLLFATPFVTTITMPGAGEAFGYVFLLAFFGSAFALLLFNKLIQVSSVVFSASVTYLIPVVAMFWGIADGEAFTLSFLIWIALIIGGIILVNRKGKRNKYLQNKHTN